MTTDPDVKAQIERAVRDVVLDYPLNFPQPTVADALMLRAILPIVEREMAKPLARIEAALATMTQERDEAREAVMPLDKRTRLSWDFSLMEWLLNSGTSKGAVRLGQVVATLINAEADLAALQQRVDATVAWLKDYDYLDALSEIRDERTGYVLRKLVLQRLAPAAPAPTKEQEK